MAVADPEVTSRASGRLSHAREALVIGVAAAIVNLLLLVRVHNEAEDSIGYLVNIRNGHASTIFNPYHLVHSWLGWGAFRIAAGLGYDGGPLVPVQALNALLGAAGLALLWLLMRRVTDGRMAAAVAVGVVGLSYGYWAYSLGADVYTLSALLLIAALFLGYRAVMEPGVAAFAAFGLATGATVLAHNSNVLFGIVGAAAILLAARDGWRERRGEIAVIARYAAGYAAGVIVAVAPLYLVALAVVGANTPSEANDWLTKYAQSGDWGKVSASSGPKAVVGSGRALVGAHFLFSLQRVRDRAEEVAPEKSLREEAYLVRDMPEAAAWGLLIVAGVSAASMLALLARWLAPRRPAVDARGRTLALLSLAWLVPYAVFVTWWEPVNPEFWIVVWIPAAILLGLPLSGHGGRGAALLVGALLGSLMVVNLAGSIGPQLTEQNDYWRERIAWYEAEASPDDLVVTNGFIETEYLRYFARTQVLNVDLYDKPDLEAEVNKIDAAIRAAGARRVLFSREVFAPASDAYSTCKEDVKPCTPLVDALRARYERRSKVVYDSDLETVWELAPEE